MVTESLIEGDEFRDEDGEEYEVVIATPHEIVAKLIASQERPGEHIHVIFERDRASGVWQERDMPEPKIRIAEAL